MRLKKRCAAGERRSEVIVFNLCTFVVPGISICGLQQLHGSTLADHDHDESNSPWLCPGCTVFDISLESLDRPSVHGVPALLHVETMRIDIFERRPTVERGNYARLGCINRQILSVGQ